MKKLLQILHIGLAILTVVVGYLSNTGLFNGQTMASVSAEYQNLFTPAGYAFSIWGLIYIGILGFAIYYGRSLFLSVKTDEEVLEQVGWWFVVSCLTNCFWVVAWLYDYTFISVILMGILLFALLKIVVNTKMELHNPPLTKFIFLWWPFCLYAGWVSVALITNIAAYLTKIHWSGFGLSESFWAVGMILVAMAVHIFMIWNRNMREFALVGVWALIAIAVANKNVDLTVFWSAMLTAGIILINIGIHGFLNRKELPFLNKRGHK